MPRARNREFLNECEYVAPASKRGRPTHTSGKNILSANGTHTIFYLPSAESGLVPVSKQGKVYILHMRQFRTLGPDCTISRPLDEHAKTMFTPEGKNIVYATWA